MSDQPSSDPSAVLVPPIDRRRFLEYVGAGAATLFSSASLGSLLQGCAGGGSPWVRSSGASCWTSPPYPVPLPGDAWPAAEDATRLASYEVRDELVLPDGFGYDVVARWGDVFGPADDPARQVRFGYNNDYTGLVPIPGTDDEHWLFVNHEYIAVRPWIEAHAEVFGAEPPELRLAEDTSELPLFRRGIFAVDGFTFDAFDAGNAVDLKSPEAADLPAEVRATLKSLAERMLSDVGVSVLRVRRLADGRFEVVADAPDHRRITAYGRQNVPGAPEEHSRFTGPAAHLFDGPPRGTLANCSGGTTPWGTFLTCEENFYNEVEEDVDPAGRPIDSRPARVGGKGDKVNGFPVFDHPVPSSVFGGGHLLDEPLDGREYGWVGEVDPATGHLAKHTALGRFRHENVALRCDAGKPLAAYMGDDRRGGHLWKFVSDAAVGDPKDPANSSLFEQGTLYVARFHDDYTGEWIPLRASTPLRRPEPAHCPSHHQQVPSRFVGGSVAVGDTERDNPELEVEQWMSIVERFAGKPFAECTLGDLVKPEPGATDEETARRADGVLAMDAFLMANASGGTPSARPEDIEVHPVDRSVYIAFTDATLSSDGSPDRRIFPDSGFESSRQYGAIYRVIEGGVESADSDPASTSFTWGKFVSSGEVAEQGGGFACADNMVFDPEGNLWMVTDITTTVQNFPTTRVVRDGTNPGGQTFPGVFGNNAMFMIPTHGTWRGVPQLFALAPMEAELCGPTFTDDGETLILSVQHPGEGEGTRRGSHPQVVQTHVVHDRAGQPFDQERTVPVGSNFPHGELDRPPRPCVVCITRKA